MKKDSPTLREWLAEGPFALSLCSSFFGFYAHCGATAALYEAGCVPARITGSSAGALVAGALGSGLEPARMAEICFALERKDFWDPGLGLGYLRGRKFANLLRLHFRAEVESCTPAVEVAVFDMLGRRTEFLSAGPLVTSVVASCAVPLLFHPVRIGRRYYLDGGIREKAGFRAHHPRERLLCLFFPSKGLTGALETRATMPRFNAYQRALCLADLPSVRPQALERGAAAFQEAYRRVRSALAEPFSSPVLDT